MGLRGNYWTCSEFSNWILRTAGAKEKPSAATSKEWKEWRKYNETHHPFAYWLADDFLGQLQDVVFWPTDKLKSIQQYIRSRFIRRAHLIDTHLPKTGYLDHGDRMLYGMFSVLNNYVESDMAYDQLRWDDNDPSEVPWWTEYRITHWNILRSRTLGMKRLDWECSLDAPGVQNPCVRQAQMAREIRSLYIWWNDVRPNRPDPGVASGYDALLENADSIDCLLDDAPDPNKEARQIARAKEKAIIEQYEEEDEEMIGRLIKLRKCLWT